MINRIKKIHFIVNALNEESRIERVLLSIAPFAASITVVDAGSSDATLAKASKCTEVKMIRSQATPFDLHGRFDEALSSIMRLEPDPWIFPITCSEVLTETLGRYLINLVNSDPSLIGINMYRQSFTFGVPTHRRRLFYFASSYINKNNVRVFKAGDWRMDLGRIHQEYKVDPRKLKNVVWLPPYEHLSLLHYRDGTLTNFEIKHTFYSDREAEERIANGERGSVFKLCFIPLLTMLYFLPTVLFSPKGFVVAVYHSFYKFQVQAKIFLSSRNW